jgi:hypothetical protein
MPQLRQLGIFFAAVAARAAAYQSLKKQDRLCAPRLHIELIPPPAGANAAISKRGPARALRANG